MLAQVAGAQESFPYEPWRNFQKEGDVQLSDISSTGDSDLTDKGSLGSTLCPPPQGLALPQPTRQPWPGLPGPLACSQPVRRAAPGV